MIPSALDTNSVKVSILTIELPFVLTIDEYERSDFLMSCIHKAAELVEERITEEGRKLQGLIQHFHYYAKQDTDDPTTYIHCQRDEATHVKVVVGGETWEFTK